MPTRYRYCPVLMDPDAGELHVVEISGLSTKHGATGHDGGRLFGELVNADGVIRLDLYSDVSRGTIVARGSIAAAPGFFDLVAQGGSGISGKAYLRTFVENDPDVVVIATFATDADVAHAAAEFVNLRAYDATDGLSHLHAKATQLILTSALPAACPHLMRGIVSSVPGMRGTRIPDLRDVANVDQLREAQAELVKALLFERQEHLEEAAAVAEAARERFKGIMEDVAAANPEEVEAQEEADSTLEIGTFIRG